MEFTGCSYCLFICVSWIHAVASARLPEITIIDVKSVSPKKVTLLWKPTFYPKRTQPEYIIRYKPKGGFYTRTFSKKTDITLKSLQPDTTYVIAVRAVNGKARGDWSDTVEIKTKSKSSFSNEDISCNVTVEEVNESSAVLKWTTSSLTDIITDFADFQIILKSKDKQLKRKTKDSEIEVTSLSPDTSYAANLYVILSSGKKIRVGRTKFQTLEVQRTAPRKLKVKSVTHKSIAVKWKHVKAPSLNDSLTGYTLQFKPRGVTNTEACAVYLDVSRKTYRIQGLLPDTKYSIRVSGQFSNNTGLFTDWLRVKTTPIFPGTEDITVYHTSPTSVLLLWYPFAGITDISNISVELWTIDKESNFVGQNIADERREFEIVGGRSYTQLHGLLPQTKYKVTLTFKGQGQCKYYKTQDFVTIDAKCVEQCDSMSNSLIYTYPHVIPLQNETFRVTWQQYESYLRIIPLQNEIFLVTWQLYRNFLDANRYRYVIRVLGEPFLFHLSTHLIPKGERYTVLRNLSRDKTYTINLQVFLETYGGQPVISQHLIVLPVKDPVLDEPEAEVFTQEGKLLWQPTSIDIVTNREVEELEIRNSNDSYEVQYIKEANISLISKLYVDENWDVENSSLMAKESPKVYKMDDIDILEETAVDIACFARGDPYPITTFLNLTSNQTLGEEDTEMSHTVSVTEPKYVGSSSLVDGRAFIGIRRFITLKNMSYWNSGQYACAAENIAGNDTSVFKITVKPKPPSKVKDLYALPLTPFEIEVGWRPPDNKSDEDPGHVIGYHVTVADEYNVILRENNVTATMMILQNFVPDTKYSITVAAYHQSSKGEGSEVQVQTPKIPDMSAPQNISLKTLNGTTIQVSWLPPKEVIERKIHLRSFLFLHREVGSERIEEMQLGRMFTNVSIIGLIPDRKYEVQVVAMSEDAQISQTGWAQGNTFRESYMNETVEPPPPHNVFLNLRGRNIMVSWLPPFPDENILVRGYTIDVFYNNTKLLTMEVEYKESSVIIYDVEMGILYRISVKARNRAGVSIDHWEELKVPVEYVTQEPVQNFEGRALSATKLELTWDPPESGVFSRYVLSYTLADDLKPELPGGGNLPATSRNYIVRSLQPFTGYVFYITPYLKDMRGVSANTTVVTLTDKPSLPPTNISLSVLNSTTILVKCSPPPEDGKNGPIIQYRVAYRESNFRDNILTDTDEDEELYFHLNGLKQDTVYEIRVRSLTVNGSGPWSPWLQERTEKRIPVLPKVPQNLTSTLSDRSIALEWSPPDQRVSELTGYVVGIGRFIPEVYRTSVTRDKTTYTFDNLDPETVYIVSVRSFNDFGESAAVFDLVTTE